MSMTQTLCVAHAIHRAAAATLRADSVCSGMLKVEPRSGSLFAIPSVEGAALLLCSTRHDDTRPTAAVLSLLFSAATTGMP